MYPRPDRPLVPDDLKPFVGDWRIPSNLTRAHNLPAETTLSELDRNVDTSHPGDSRQDLADEVVRAVQSRYSDIEFSTNLVEIDPHDRTLSVRARNCLFRAGYHASEGTVMVSLGDLAGLRNLGARTLLEVLTGPPLKGTREVRPSPAVRKAAREMERRRWSRRIRSRDPRIGSRIRALVSYAETARDAAQILATGAIDPRTARRISKQIRDLIAEADRVRRLSLEEELKEIVNSLTPKASAARALLLRFGFSGAGPMTLEAVGNEVSITRERVRQIQKRFVEQLENSETWTPALDRALRLAEKSVPISVDGLERLLKDDGIVHGDFAMEALLQAAELFSKETHLVLEPETRIVHSEAHYIPASKIRSAARRLVTHWGATTIEELRSVLEAEGYPQPDSSVLGLALESGPAFHWLNDEKEWFWLSDTPRNRLLNQVEKIMSVAGSIDIGTLRDGVGRHHRMKGFRPPREVLGRLLETSGLYRRQDGLVVEGPSLRDWRDVLGDFERTLVDILFEHGPVMRREDLEEIAVGRGLNVNSFYLYLTYSPVLARFAAGVFGLRGAKVSAAEVQALIPPRVGKQRLLDHGWTSEGDVWIGYRVSRSVVQSGVISSPAALRSVIEGTFELYSEDETPMGTLVVRDATIWGLSPFLRRRGVEEGDHLVIRIDIRGGRAVAAAGEEELLVRLQKAE